MYKGSTKMSAVIKRNLIIRNVNTAKSLKRLSKKFIMFLMNFHGWIWSNIDIAVIRYIKLHSYCPYSDMIISNVWGAFKIGK